MDQVWIESIEEAAFYLLLIKIGRSRKSALCSFWIIRIFVVDGKENRTQSVLFSFPFSIKIASPWMLRIHGLGILFWIHEMNPKRDCFTEKASLSRFRNLCRKKE